MCPSFKFFLNLYNLFMFKINKYLFNKNTVNTNVIFSIHDSGNRLKIGSKISVITSEWDFNLQKIKQNRRTSVKLNNRIETVYTFIEDECINHYNNYGFLKMPLLKKVINNYLNNNRNSSIKLTDLIDDYIHDKNRIKKYSKATISTYTTIKKNIIEFEKYTNKVINLKEITLETLLDFKDYLYEEKGCIDNTIKGKFDHLKSFLYYAGKKKLFDITILDDLKFGVYDSINIALTENEVQRIHEYKFKDKKLEEVKYFFLVQIYTALRTSDLKVLQKHNIKEKTIEIIALKTKSKCIIPISDKLLEIMNLIDITTLNSRNWVKTYNYNIKKVCKLVGLDEMVTKTTFKGNDNITKQYPKYNLISPHTGRRTFVTILMLRNVPASKIIIITGHKSLESFYRYIKVNKDTATEDIRLELNNIYS